MRSEDFELLSGILRERSGLALSRDKIYLVESRLKPLARKRGLKDLGGLLAALRGRRQEELERAVTEAMTTNESSFFRDGRPFARFRGLVLPVLLERRKTQRRIRIWCAACSTGQEPYSLAMCLAEERPRLAGWRTEIVATDLACGVLEKARAGIYTQFEVQRGLPVQMLVKHFDQADELWQIKPEIRAMVTYREQNLLEDFSGLGAFDVVFCRNVLIYFDAATKVDVLARLARMMPADGFLFLGGAETVLGLDTSFEPMPGERGIYRLKPQTPQ